jgi:hypothetical protein
MEIRCCQSLTDEIAPTSQTPPEAGHHQESTNRTHRRRGTPRKSTSRNTAGAKHQGFAEEGRPVPPDPRILGFHPENVEKPHRHHGASKKGTTPADATAVTQKGKGFPWQIQFTNHTG